VQYKLLYVCQETPFLNKLKHEISQLLQDSDTHNKAEISVGTDARVSKLILPTAVHSVYRSSSLFKQEVFGGYSSSSDQVNEQKERLMFLYFSFGSVRV